MDDGSSDGSAAWVAEKAKSDTRVKLIRLSRNFGHQIAITPASITRRRRVVIIDADLQDPPVAIPSLLDIGGKGLKWVYAVRHSARETGMKYSWRTSFFRVFRRMSNVPVPMDAGVSA